MKQLRKKVVDDNERTARRAMFEEMFNDFHRSRASVYKMNFVRGIFFGFGSVLGGTVVLALFVWVLSVTGALVPGAASFVDGVINILQQK